jgi:hypothetical protein
VTPRPQPSRSLWFPLALWLGLSVLALTVAGADLLLGLAVAVAGGAFFGLVSAARLDGRRRRRRRRRPAIDDDPRPTPDPHPIDDNPLPPAAPGPPGARLIPAAGGSPIDAPDELSARG